MDSTADDLLAEQLMESFLERGKPRSISSRVAVVAEEKMKRPDWNGVTRVCPTKDLIALVDPLDGTKLRQRDFPNWCIAVVFFGRTDGEVLASIVGHAVGDIYYATRSGRAFRQSPIASNPIRNYMLRLRGPIEIAPNPIPGDSHLAFVAQSPDSFLEMAGHSKLILAFKRIYNLGGNPLLAKLADAKIDAVIELRGHLAHDVVPGAFIARRAGAVIWDLEGRDLEWRDSLLHPEPTSDRRLRYIAASSRETAAGIRAHLAPGP